MRIRFVQLVAMLSVVSILAAAAPVAAHPGTSQLRRDVEALQALGVTGVLARLETPDGVQVARSGVANVDTGRPVPADPYLRLASTTKTFVAVVVLQLVAEGRLSLSDPVQRWLPGVVAGNGNDGRAITVRELLQQTTGLYNYILDLVPDYLSPEDYRHNRWRTYTPEQLVAIAMSHPPNNVVWDYSNTNYVLAGMLVKAVTGRGWDREVQDRIINPLRLRHTSTPGTWPFLPEPHARNYHQFAPGGPLTDTTIAIRALDSGSDGSMIGTASDLNRFFAALLEGRLLPPAQLAEMQRLVTIPEDQGYPPGTGYGLGLFYTPLPCGGGYWRHGGNGFGYVMEPVISSDHSRRLTVAVFTRSFDPDTSDPRDKAVERLIRNAMC